MIKLENNDDLVFLRLKLDHLYIETRHFEKTLAFWKALGFETARVWGDDGHRACRLVCEESSLVLAESTVPVGPVVHFRVPEVDGLNRELAKHEAVTVRTPLEDTHWGTRWIRVEDPDGRVHVLEKT